MSETSVQRSVFLGAMLIVAPLIGMGLKLMSTGWMIVLMIMGPIVILVLGYVLQIIIASQGFFSSRGLFGASMKRASIATWLTSIGVILLGIFMPDGGDSGYGSTLQVWLGAYRENADAVHAATDTINDLLALLVAVLWIGGFIWLVIEWILALARRKKLNA